jgi:CBS domain-containing protein
MLHIRQLPVVNNKRQIVGMISKGDLFDYIFREYLLSS